MLRLLHYNTTLCTALLLAYYYDSSWFLASFLVLTFFSLSDFEFPLKLGLHRFCRVVALKLLKLLWTGFQSFAAIERKTNRLRNRGAVF